MRARDPDKLLCSPNWRAIKAGFQTFADGICWGVGNGERNIICLIVGLGEAH